MSFGAFMEGLQGGVKSGQGIRRERQLDDIYDAATRKLKNEEKADNMARADFGDVGDDSALGDPFGQQLFNWAKGLFKGGDDATTAVPDPGAAALQDKVSDVETIRTGIPQEDPSSYPGAGLAPYANGGRVQKFESGGQPLSEEELRKQKAERYGTTPQKLVSDLGNATGTVARAIPAAAKWGVHKVADAIDVGTDDPVDNYAEGAFDTPRVLAGQVVRKFGDFVGGDIPFYDETGGAKPQALPTPAPTAPPARGVRPGAPPSAVARKPAAAAPAAAIPTPGAAPAKQAEAPVMSPDVIKQIPWDKVNVMDLPKFKTQDWVKYRESAARQMVMRGGVTTLDAYDKVDQQVIGMQQRGTKALLQEAIMRVQSGDLKGAGNALVAMFQYVPSGTDAVVGTYNGQLVAQFVDEQTGQPVGEPTPVDGKMLGDLWQQYANPAAWAEMAQDRAKLADQEARTGIMQGTLDLAERRLDEVEIPEAQSSADYRALIGEASMAKAVGGGAEGLKPSEQLASDKDVRDVVSQYAMMQDEDGNLLHPKLQDPNIQHALLTAIMKMKRQSGAPTEEILLQILNAAKE
jgi:hypothetical protein